MNIAFLCIVIKRNKKAFFIAFLDLELNDKYSHLTKE